RVFPGENVGLSSSALPRMTARKLTRDNQMGRRRPAFVAHA
ncbi:hypothetical protein RSAG8_11817, partial [Rhizoctonia solani AG-8 WAC10335]